MQDKPPPHPNLRVVLYDDSPVYGGHEVMTLLGLDGLLRAGARVLFVYATENGKLGEALVKLQRSHAGLEICPQAPPSRKLQGVLNHLQRRSIARLAEMFQRFNTDVVLCAQGDLELSSRGVLAGRRAGIRTVSYIPFAHTQAQMGAKFGALRDPFNGYLLNAPDAFITISLEAAQHFRHRGTRVPVDVVYNGIDIGRFGGDRREARRKLGLPEQAWVVALCGRLEVKQKGQLLLLEALQRSPWLREHTRILLVGDGPDEALLRQTAEAAGLTPCVAFTGWCDTKTVYPALDALVIASRFEGMPLVMLEALVSGVPVVASDRDGMRELLPRDWRFRPGDAAALAEVLRAVLQSDCTDVLKRLASRIEQEMSVEAFQRNFTEHLFRHGRARSAPSTAPNDAATARPAS